jgi:hypothetical protein
MPFQTVNLKASGLYTNPNYLSSVPEGSFLKLSNFNHDRDDVIEKRRGFFVYSNLFAENTKQIISYKDKLVTLFGTTLAYDNLGTFTSFTGSFVHTNTNRIKYMNANGNLYITTTEGVKKLDAKNSSDFGNIQWRQAGTSRAPSVNAELSGTIGFILPLSKVAYRVVWGYKDRNNNLILSSPSEIEIVTNESLTDSANVELTFSVPVDADQNYFYQIYRSPIATAPTLMDLDTVLPQDELNLVIEEFPSTVQFTNKVITVLDVTPEDFRDGGTPLYTNAVSGEGILSTNDQPPLCEDMALYRNFSIYANTKTKHQYVFNLLSVDDLYIDETKLIISDGTNFEEYTFSATEDIPTKKIKLETSGSVGFNVDQTAKSIAKVINSQTSGFVRAYYISAIDDVPGQVLIEKSNLADEAFTVALNNGDFEEFNQSPAQVNDIENVLGNPALVTTKIQDFDLSLVVPLSDTIVHLLHGYYTGQEVVINNAGSVGIVDGIYYIFRIDENSYKLCLTRSETKKETPSFVDITATGVITATAQETHELLDNEEIYIINNSISGKYKITLVSNTSFTIPLNVAISVVGGNFYRVSAISENEANPNRLAYSKLQQPEAVPAINTLDIGTKDKAIKRIVSLRDSLFIFKEEGIYRLAGQSPTSFSVDLFDNSASVIAPDTAAVLNNKIYILTTQGVLMISDTGVDIISKPIENILLQYGKNPNFSNLCFGFASESDRSYYMWVPEKIDDTNSTLCLRFNTDTNSWSTWDRAQTCGVVNTKDDKIYLGSVDGYIEAERKNLDRTDYADREFDVNIGTFAIFDKKIKNISPLNLLNKGDCLTQTQYLTIAKFNNILNKLDNDLLAFKPINSIDLGFPTTINTSGHNLETSDIVLIKNVQGTAKDILNTTHTITKIDANVFTIQILTNIYTASDGDFKYAYFANLFAEAGDDLVGKVRDLSARLQIDQSDMFLDSNGYTGFYGAGANFVWDLNNEVSSQPDLQSKFNEIIDRLNETPGLYYANYKYSEGTTLFEEVVLDKDVVRKEITLNTMPAFIQGSLRLYKGIDSRAIYNYTSMGDPSVSKRIIDAAVILESNNFTNCVIEYATDISKWYEGKLYTAEGVGLFGNQPFGNDGFGGIATSQPARTLVPRDKSRCRYISPALNHYNARESISLYGFNMTAEVVSQRAFRGRNG